MHYPKLYIFIHAAELAATLHSKPEELQQELNARDDKIVQFVKRTFLSPSTQLLLTVERRCLFASVCCEALTSEGLIVTTLMNQMLSVVFWHRYSLASTVE